MKTVPLTQGEVAFVDDEDYELVMRHKWQVKRVKNSERKYAITSIMRNGKKTSMTMHRLILNHYFPLFDHRDLNGLNNQKRNLRVATRAENGMNRRLLSHSSRFKGVSWNKQASKWTAHIRINTVLRHLGYFSEERLAAEAYDRAAESHFGEFCKNNKQLGAL